MRVRMNQKRRGETPGRGPELEEYRQPQETTENVLSQVRGQVEPAFAFAELYLRLLSKNLGLGALAVWFGAEGLEHYVADRSKEYEWKDTLSDLLRTATRLGPAGQSVFCSALRKHPDADRRCHECDAKWIARARKSGRSWAYQCHAGLSEVVAPIMVKGKQVGEVMGGQVAFTERLPNGFDDVWRRVGDIGGLDREELARAYGQIGIVDADGLRGIQMHLRAAARALGALVESVADLISRESLLGQVRSYAERDFALYALTHPSAPADEVHARAKALGYSEPPSVVIAIVADQANRSTFAAGRPRSGEAFPGLFEAAQRLLRDVDNALVSAIRPGEIVVLLSPEKTRNPFLRRLQVEELAERIKKELQGRCAEPLVLGVSDWESEFRSLAKAYEEAHANLGKDLGGKKGDSTVEAAVHGAVLRMPDLGLVVRRALRERDRSMLDEALEGQLRVVCGCPADSGAVRQCLFTQLVMNLLGVLRPMAAESRALEDVEKNYALAVSSLHTGTDMAGWFHQHLLPLVDAAFCEACSVAEQIVVKACEITVRRLAESVRRDEVAEALGFSGTYFGKVFRSRTGMTWRAFVKRLRAAKAQKLLLVPGKSINDIAGQLGYSSTVAFSRSFERVCGASPSAYRNNPQAFRRIILPEGLEAR